MVAACVAAAVAVARHAGGSSAVARVKALAEAEAKTKDEARRLMSQWRWCGQACGSWGLVVVAVVVVA